MIKKITLTNFKIFKDPTDFNLSKLTLLSGINGRGKSSFLQALLVLKQSLDAKFDVEKRVVLNGSCVQLGEFSDVKNSSTSVSEKISFQFEFENGGIFSITLLPDLADSATAKLDAEFPAELNVLAKIHYVAADRVGPQLFYRRSTMPPFLTVGTRGEFVGNVLFQKREDLVHDSLYRGENRSKELLIQVGEWLSYILDTENLKINSKEVGNGVIILSFQIGNNDKEYMPSNVGFGYSYILPIVITGLIAKPDEIIIVENPEAHLHPKGQAKLVEFLCLVAKLQVQIIIESHSEHILNALRVQISSEGSTTPNTDVSVLFFQNIPRRVTSVTIDQDGGIDIWPENFFDQSKKDLRLIHKL